MKITAEVLEALGCKKVSDTEFALSGHLVLKDKNDEDDQWRYIANVKFAKWNDFVYVKTVQDVIVAAYGCGYHAGQAKVRDDFKQVMGIK